MKRAAMLTVFALFSSVLVSCSSTPKAQPGDFDTSGDRTPQAAMKNFRKSLRKNKWRYVHVLLSKRARNCYSQDKLNTFLTRTVPGALEKLRLLQWRAEFKPGADKKRAIMTLTHPNRPEYSQTYTLLRQNGYWRLDWSMADVLNVPRSVENCN